MLSFLQDFIHFFALVGTLVSGGALLNDKLRRNKVLVIFCIAWSFISFAYLFRPLFQPSNELFASFDRQSCLQRATADEGLLELRMTEGTLDVRDFRGNLEPSSNGSGQDSFATYQEDFQLFFDLADHRFSILLNLVNPPVTPGSAARSVAEYLQLELCLEKHQICALNYEMGTVRATNILFPDLNGQDLTFEYCG